LWLEGLARVASTAKRGFIRGDSLGLCWWYKKVNTVVNAAVFFWPKESYMTTQIVGKTVYYVSSSNKKPDYT
jgi:hypothetical protein